MRQELFNAVMNGMHIHGFDHTLISSFIEDTRKDSSLKIAFDSIYRDDEVCVHGVSDNSEFNGTVWDYYDSICIIRLEIEIKEEDARVPLTQEQKEMFIDALEMLLL